jgi:alkylhydroperoxidase/carboxymuconolactone decarboxylase family protein YurZ
MSDMRDLPLPSPEALRARLDTLRSRRGFLLEHHGAMAAAMPDLHAAYLAMYTALTVTDRHIAPLCKECIWLGILVTARESVGTHHLELLRTAGGTTAMARAIIAMAGFAPALDALAFAERHWSAFLPDLSAADSYGAALDALRGTALDPEMGELVMLAVHAARGSHDGVALHLRRGYGMGIAEEKMAEALSYLMWPCGVNAFLDACAVWHRLMAEGTVTPSARFRAWAETPGPGPFRADSGARVGGFDAPAET